MVARMFVALLVALHGVPLAALAPFAHCGRCVERAEVKEGDHCARSPAPKGYPCARHGADHRHEQPDSDGPTLHAAGCTCRQASVMTPSTSDPLVRPLRFELSVIDPVHRMVALAPPADRFERPAPPSPPPQTGLL